jgi:hypothetical protein
MGEASEDVELKVRYVINAFAHPSRLGFPAQCHSNFFLIPEGCLIIAQLFKVGSLAKSGLSPEGTTETVSYVMRGR